MPVVMIAAAAGVAGRNPGLISNPPPRRRLVPLPPHILWTKYPCLLSVAQPYEVSDITQTQDI